jgi:lipoyl(octanoyl) transferase
MDRAAAREVTTLTVTEENCGRAEVELLDWGVVPYGEALARQRKLFDELVAAKEGNAADAGAPGGGKAESKVVTSGGGKAGWLIFCEHPHVYTIGKSGQAENLLVGEDFLRSRGAELFRTERGGDITYHGPGQLVGYPILDLERVGLGLREYIEAVEQSVIEAVAEFGIEAGRVAGKTGVWVTGSGSRRLSAEGQGGERGAETISATGGAHNRADGRFSRKPEGARKICAIGVRASRGVVMHGFALNVTTDLEWFGLINPCGMAGAGVTSVEKEIRVAAEMASGQRGGERVVEGELSPRTDDGRVATETDSDAKTPPIRTDENLMEEVKRVLREKLEANLRVELM